MEPPARVWTTATTTGATSGGGGRWWCWRWYGGSAARVPWDVVPSLPLDGATPNTAPTTTTALHGQETFPAGDAAGRSGGVCEVEE